MRVQYMDLYRFSKAKSIPGKKTHIRRGGKGFQPALCGARPQVMVHGGLLTVDCRRCLQVALQRGLEKNLSTGAVRRFRRRLRALGLRNWRTPK